MILSISASLPVIYAIIYGLLLALGGPMPERGSIVSQTLRLLGMIKDCQVKLVILDLC
jgi:hypothetical protein